MARVCAAWHRGLRPTQQRVTARMWNEELSRPQTTVLSGYIGSRPDVRRHWGMIVGMRAPSEHRGGERLYSAPPQAELLRRRRSR
jgi:hypothetical protein